MTKKLMALFLSLSILCSLVGCSAENNDDFDSTDWFSGTSTLINSESEEPKGSNNTPPEKETSQATLTTPEEKTETAESKTPPPTTVADIKVEETVVGDDVIKQPDTEPIDNVIPKTNHLALSPSKYYQLSSLKGDERALYLAITNAIAASESIVDISKLSVSEDQAVAVFQKVHADHPQFFYLSRRFMLAYRSSDKKMGALVLLYTDGTTTDEFDEKIRLKKSADRDIINQKIAALNSKVQSFVNTISADCSEVIKEKLIYEHVVQTVSYDDIAAANIDNYELTVPHAFDIYGAAVEGKAICEGYAKLFQYLCYTVGINSTQVIGVAGGNHHMWSAALIEGEWYQADATWDDSEKLMSYSYFNITESKLSADHQIDSSVLAVPDCTATENSYINAFAVYVADLSGAPANYEEAFETAKLLGEDKIYIYFEGYQPDRTGAINVRRYLGYLETWFYSENSFVWAYLNEKGIVLSALIDKSNEFIVISMNY